MEQKAVAPQGMTGAPLAVGDRWIKLAAPAFVGMLLVLLFVFAFLNAFNFNIDDIAHIYAANDISIVHYQNRRFISVLLCIAMAGSGIDYYDIIGIWALFFVASIAYLSFELGYYLRLGLFGSLWIAAAAGMHGFMSELYSFTSAYINFAGAIFGAALTIAGLRLLRTHPLVALLTGVVGVLWCMGSYQPYIMVPIAAVLLRCIRDHMRGEFRGLPFREFGYLAVILSAGALSTVLFSMAYPPSSGARSPSLSIALGNGPKLPATLAAMFQPNKTGWGLFFPRHEQAVYLIGLILLIVSPLTRLRSGLAQCGFSLAAAIAILILVAGPLNILFPQYWPSARSVSYDAFLFPAIVACLAAGILEHCGGWRLRNVVAACAAAFILLSMANQLSLFFTRHLQRNADVALANAIVADLEERARRNNSNLAETPIAVVGTWRNAAQRPTIYLDYGASAFTAPWSRLAILRAVSGLPLREFIADPARCPSETDRFEILRVEQGWLVCLR